MAESESNYVFQPTNSRLNTALGIQMATEVYEQLIAAVFEAQSFWVRCNTTLLLPATQFEKKTRVELDVIALRSSSPQQLLIVECKSTSGSNGLDWNTYAGTNQNRKHRYHLFFDAGLRTRIEAAVRQTYALSSNVSVIFCLASATTQRRDYRRIARHLRKQGMRLLGQHWLRNELRNLAKSSSYQNNPAVLAAALLFHPKRDGYA